jgi:MFS family permease
MDRAHGHPLATRAFVLIWLGLFVSVTGDSFYRVALILRVADNGPFGLAGLGIALALPTALVGLFAGVLIDRSNVVRLLIRSDLGRCVIVAALGFLLFQQRPSLFVIFALAALLAFMSVFFTPAIQTLLPEIARRDNNMLIAMDSWILGTLSIVGVIGPAAAGVLLQYASSAVLMFVDAATFAFSALMIFLARPPAVSRHDGHTSDEVAGKLRAIGEGLHFLLKHPVLRPCFLVIPVMDFATSAIPFVLPLLLRADHDQTSIQYGAELAALAFGRLFGVTLVNKTQIKTRRGLILRLNFVAQGICILLLAVTGGAWISLVPMALAGIPAGASQIAMSSYIQLQVEPQMRGRVFSALISLVTWVAAFGPIVFVGIASALTPGFAFAAIGAVLLAGGCRLLLCKPLADVR